MLKRKHVLLASAVMAAAPLVGQAAVITFGYDTTVSFASNTQFTTGTGTASIVAGAVTIPAGDFFRINMNVLVTGNNNATSGGAYDTNAGNAFVQPAKLGLAGNGVFFTDNNTAAVVPRVVGGNAVVTISKPAEWTTTGNGPASAATGNVGSSAQPIGGFVNPGGDVLGSDNTTFHYATIGAGATPQDVFTNLTYQAVGSGGAAATLTPAFSPGTIAVVVVDGAGSAGAAPTYTSRVTNGTDTISGPGALIVHAGTAVVGTSIISLTAAANSAGAVSVGTNFSGTSNPAGATGNLVNVLGSNNGYLRGELNAITGTGKTGQAEVKYAATVGGATNDPGTTNIALDVTDGANAAGSAQYIADLNALIADINDATKGFGAGSAFADGSAPASAQAALNFLNLGKSGESKYDLIIQLPSGTHGLGDEFLGIDLTQDNALAAGLKIVDIAAVPEPASMAGLLIGASGLLMGRRKRKA